ncbi:LuxR C-terminal-related transcriptional regulator [Buttiauxella noackiae]|uniref:helix-turn-helix domain-containing protein n=1 Tax=Buttiauxella noackiae TaxID=82992 RepID=UPI0028D092DF|nr:LuxR C-terminal-related transcriptional regulator [Buttiauxella noackiae]
MNIIIMSNDNYFSEGLSYLLKRHPPTFGLKDIYHCNTLSQVLAYVELNKVDLILTELYGNNESANDTYNFVCNMNEHYEKVKVVIVGDPCINYSIIFGSCIAGVLDRKVTTKQFIENVISITDLHTKKAACSNVKISHMERSIINMHLTGESNNEISRLLGISMKTVYTHKKNCISKLGLRNRNCLSLHFKSSSI